MAEPPKVPKAAKSRSGPSLAHNERPSPKLVVTVLPETIELLDAIVEQRGTTRSEVIRFLVSEFSERKCTKAKEK